MELGSSILTMVPLPMLLHSSKIRHDLLWRRDKGGHLQ
jgi:hypothetical protein